MNEKDKEFLKFLTKSYDLKTDKKDTAMLSLIFYHKLKLISKRNNMKFPINKSYEKLKFNLSEEDMDNYIVMLFATDKILPK